MAPVVSYRDLRKQARRKLPRFAFDFVDGGAGDEAGLDRNEAAYRAQCLQPRVLINSDRALPLKRRFLGRDWALPFGIPPIGLAGIAWPEIDLLLAEAAEQAGIPYVASTPATVALERLRQRAPKSAWFQLYVGKSEEITADLLARAKAAGYRTLVVTADVPRPGRRLRDLRNGFALPLKPGPRLAFDLMRHPGWALRTARHGAPRFANLEPYAERGSSTQSLAQLMAGQSSGRLDWALLREIRDGWSGQIILKGVSAPQDAVKAAETGVDAVWVSNHGGRQLSSAPAPLDALPGIRRALPAGFPLAFDGGIRSGEDMIKALTAGADFVFAGRPFLYAIAALGPSGASRLIAQFASELENTMAQIGWSDLDLQDGAG
ncbi:alpha-hydroxy acid oxidase [Ponticoccus alexandrii]|uniref:Alpha-hydroxy-acid oxidizing protein n=1 Tax=Ponticoccus alexandrii TaxID=1943633 RepID=A0ABX7FEU4_9RHOB|nr:alpha-hydroxy acid oxidase [Ponticoccus alexandrii]ETA49998.1 alpha-hydroxy acid dehydrogenase [Rhodobacteraceae bacterium PD-2]QRF69050.1 alpha-hydroxy-acid oxidizing protein [Ponticoccus alexandrii]